MLLVQMYEYIAIFMKQELLNDMYDQLFTNYKERKRVLYDIVNYFSMYIKKNVLDYSITMLHHVYYQTLNHTV